jgi:hypothetical protein
LASPFISTLNPPARKFYEPIIADFIAKRALTVVASEPGVGKSHLMVDIAATASQSMPTAIVIPEAEDEFWETLMVWRSYYKLETPGLVAMIEPLNLLDKVVVDAFIRHAKAEKIEFVNIDGLSYCLPGETDSDGKAMALVCDSLYRIIRELGCGVLVNHHTGWNTSRERGSIRLRQSARVVAMLRRQGSMIILECEKANRRKFLPRTFEFEPHDVGVVMLPPQSLTISGALTIHEQSVIDALRLDSVGSQAPVRKIYDATGIATPTLYRICSRLTANGYLDEDVFRGNSKRYTLTDMGENAATITPAGEAILTSLIPSKSRGCLQWEIGFSSILQQTAPFLTRFSRKKDGVSPDVSHAQVK